MSSTVLKIISTAPDYVPTVAQQERAKTFLSDLYDPNQTELSVTDTIEFVDQGENFERVSCNLCGQEISPDEWQDQMDKAYEVRFNDLNFQTSCNHLTSLNDLNYEWPAGFAKFIISISDPQREIDDEAFERLQEIFGTKMRKVWAHY